jgi:hypothetical protein
MGVHHVSYDLLDKGLFSTVYLRFLIPSMGVHHVTYDLLDKGLFSFGQ